MKRVTTAVLAGATVATLAYASASALHVTSKPLQAGGTSVSCDTTGIDVSWGLEVNTNSVTDVKVKNIDAACYGKGAKVFVAVDGVRVGDAALVTQPANSQHVIEIDARTPESINDVRVYIG